MKTADQWAAEQYETMRALDREADRVVGEDVVPVEDIFAIVVRRIQLDAMKEGMRRAAAEANKKEWEWVDFNCAKGISEAILTAAEQLTEKDL